ncbi:MAG: hypothetical protein ABIJ56_13850 [Pseudomonadota bacterium]
MRAGSMFAVLLRLSAACAAAACDGGGNGEEDAAVDADAQDAPDFLDMGAEFCTSHPNACHTGGGGIDPFDCCRTPKECCNLCFPAENCGSRTDCMETCPRTMPCEGLPGSSALACWYNPDDFSGTVYCPVSENPNPAFSLACTGGCSTGVECPLPEDPYGDTALCCPENWRCDIVSGYNLPYCVEP